MIIDNLDVPHMNEKPTLDIDRTVALWRLGRTTAAQLQQFAVEAMSAGFYGEALLELAWYPCETTSECDDLLERALQEMGRRSLSVEEAGIRVAKEVASRILEGSISIEQGAREIEKIYDEADSPGALAVWVYYADAYPEVNVRTQEILRADIIEAAKRLVTTTVGEG